MAHPGAKTFPQWLSFALSAPDKYKTDGCTPAACVGLSLIHVNGQLEKEIHAVQIGGRKFDDAAVTSLAEMLYGLAQTDAQNLTGKQQYVVYAHYEDQPPGPPKTRFPLMMNGHIVNMPGDLSTEGPTDEGRRQQRMRHDEAYSQMLVTTLANTINMQNAFMKVQHDALLEKTRENRDLFQTTHEMLLDKVKADREHELKVLEYERNTKLMAGITKLAPAMMNTISGKEIVPQGTVDTAILEALADALDEKTMMQLAPLLAKLPQESVGILMSRLQQIEEAKNVGQDRLALSIGKMNSSSLAEAELDGEIDGKAH